MSRLSLRTRLLLAGVLCIWGALGLAALGLSALFATHAERRAELELTQHFDQLLAGLTGDASGLTGAGPMSDPRFVQVYGGLYWQIDSGAWQGQSRSLWDGALALSGTAEARYIEQTGPTGGKLLVRVQEVVLPASLGGAPAQVAVAMDMAQITAARTAFGQDMLPYLGVLGLALMLAAAGQVQLGLRPLRNLHDRLTELRARPAQRMGTAWPQEVRPLTTEIDALMDQHDIELDRAQGRAADLAHGLKTPLQALLGEAARLDQAGQHQVASSLQDLAARMQRQVDLELARTRFVADPVAVDCVPHQVAEGVLSVLRRLPSAQNIRLRNDIPQDAKLPISMDELAEVLGALTENAVRHARSQVTLFMANGALLIADDGPGIPERDRQRVLERGARMDERGSGLGLAITQDILSRRGGRLTLGVSSEGGLLATVSLPA